MTITDRQNGAVINLGELFMDLFAPTPSISRVAASIAILDDDPAPLARGLPSSNKAA